MTTLVASSWSRLAALNLLLPTRLSPHLPVPSALALIKSYKLLLSLMLHVKRSVRCGTFPYGLQAFHKYRIWFYRTVSRSLPMSRSFSLITCQYFDWLFAGVVNPFKMTKVWICKNQTFARFLKWIGSLTVWSNRIVISQNCKHTARLSKDLHLYVQERQLLSQDSEMNS